jgi:hypothetical protein
VITNTEKSATTTSVAASSPLPGFANVVSGSATLTATHLVATLNLADLPSTFTIDQPWVPDNATEYSWQADIDMDRNGSLSAGDLSLAIKHFIYPYNRITHSATLSGGFQKDLCS